MKHHGSPDLPCLLSQLFTIQRTPMIVN